MESVILSAGQGVGMSVAETCSRDRSARSLAAESVVCGAITANTSPPHRHKTSVSRKAARRTPARVLSTRSAAR